MRSLVTLLPLFAALTIGGNALAQNVSPRFNSVRAKKLTLDGDGPALDAPSTGAYWNNTTGTGGVADKPARILRFSDRLLVGLAAKWSGNYADFSNDFHWNMGNGYYAYLPRNAQVQVVNPYGQIGGYFAGNTANSSSMPGITGSLCCNIPLAIQSFNDATGGQKQAAWGLYSTLVRGPGAGSMVNEIDVMNAGGNVVRASSYQGGAPNDWTVGLALQAGGEGWFEANAHGQPAPWPTNHPASTALFIGGNGSTWDKGITIQSGSISPTTDGSTVGMELPRSHLVRWVFDTSGTTGAFIDSQVSNPGNQMGLQFSDYGALFLNRGGTLFAQINVVPNAVNRPMLSAGAAGAAVSLSALGSDTNIDIKLEPAGGGLIDLRRGAMIQSATPASPSQACRQGTMMADTFNLYMCVAEDSWRRIPWSTFSPTTDGATVGIELPRSHLVRWVFDTSGTTGAFIDSQVSNPGNQMGLQFSDYGALFLNRGGTLFAQINVVPNAVNRPMLSAGAAGAAVSLSALGSDTNIDIKLEPAGGGLIDLRRGAMIQSATPASPSQACRQGTMMADTFNLYMCVAENSWRRIPWSTF